MSRPITIVGVPSLIEDALEEIRGRILSCRIRPGSIITVQRLAPELQMSRTPVSEALKILCGEKLVSVLPRVGYLVAPVTSKDVEEIFELRRVLEPFAVELALKNATDLELRDFRRTALTPHGPVAINSEGEVDLAVVDEQVRVHDAFHLRLAEMSGNTRLVETIRGLLQATRRARMPVMPKWDHETRTGRPSGHRIVADAVAARDVEGAVRGMADHVHMAQMDVMAALAESPAAHMNVRRGARRR